MRLIEARAEAMGYRKLVAALGDDCRVCARSGLAPAIAVSCVRILGTDPPEYVVDPLALKVCGACRGTGVCRS